MKKSIVFGALALAGAAFAVESATVGYSGKDAEKGKFTILGAQFEQVSGGTSIEGLISGVSETDYDGEGAFVTTAAQVQIPYGGGYLTRYYLANGWYDKGDDNWDQKPGWCDEDGLIATDELTPGEAIWLKDPNGNANVIVSGAVPTDDSSSISCPVVFALRANAYPKTITLNTTDMVVTGAAEVNIDAEGAFRLTAPQIQIPFGGGYLTRWYVADAWYDKGNDDWDQKPGWCDEDGLMVDDVIPVAQGFWTKGVGSTLTLTFNK